MENIVLFGLVLWHINYCRLLIANQFSYIQMVLFQALQFSVRIQFTYIRPKDRTPSGATIPSKNGPRSDGNKMVLHNCQSPSITGASPSDCFEWYTEQLLIVGLTPFYRDAVGVFSIQSRKKRILFFIYIYIYGRDLENKFWTSLKRNSVDRNLIGYKVFKWDENKL